MTVRYEVRGADTLARTLRSAGNDLDTLGEEAAAGAARTASTARSRAPRRRGRLAASIRSRREGREGAVLEAGVPYAGVIDFGWRARRIRPQPYLWATFVSDTPAITAAVLAGIKRRLGRVRGA